MHGNPNINTLNEISSLVSLMKYDYSNHWPGHDKERERERERPERERTSESARERGGGEERTSMHIVRSAHLGEDSNWETMATRQNDE